MKPVLRSTHLLTIAAISLSSLAQPLHSADFSDPTWPCIQRKVERLSTGLMWPHPIEETGLAPEQAAAVGDLVDRLVLRRVPLDEVEPFVSTFTDAYGTDTALLGQVFSKVFDRLSLTRTSIIRGIEDYSLKQIALSEQIDTTRAAMKHLMSAEKPDFDQVDALEEKLDWDERIYTDRAQSLTYVCETPALIEKRLFAISQILQARISD